MAYTVGFITIGYYISYLSKYYNLTFRKYLNINHILIFLSIDLVIGFIIPYTITNDLIISRKIFLILPIFLILFLAFIIYKSKIKKYFGFKNKYENYHALAGLSGIFSIISVPFTMLLLGDSQSIEQTLFTVGYFFICVEYFLYGNNIQQLYSYGLTDREIEILNLIINNNSIKYLEMSHKLNISEKTISAHLSNIYKKVGVKNKKELIIRIAEKKL
ncbi:DNA-binding CsgD family transcriptional regulator [Chryseobacterium rhizosphaerae]|uniref:helix-turn-helix transcriptional regulator n=1 Tax=Chryseobacterium rhizosphaerae TaxID=395937 RepID=UPI0028628186|nr:helix-turn-helix transcriptional regulator [Chryseobacterium rhizosphaerae]MDR6547612.1 DNA-binding CsgD family transcriptional regulator [Chryseobacterium rhizosphaerae]